MGSSNVVIAPRAMAGTGRRTHSAGDICGRRHSTLESRWAATASRRATSTRHSSAAACRLEARPAREIVLERDAGVLRGNRELLVSSYLGEQVELQAAEELEAGG